MPAPKRITPAQRRAVPTPAVSKTVDPPRAPEPMSVVQARKAVNVASLAFELTRTAHAVAGERLNDAQQDLARAMAAPR